MVGDGVFYANSGWSVLRGLNRVIFIMGMIMQLNYGIDSLEDWRVLVMTGN